MTVPVRLLCGSASTPIRFLFDSYSTPNALRYDSYRASFYISATVNRAHLIAIFLFVEKTDQVPE